MLNLFLRLQAKKHEACQHPFLTLLPQRLEKLGSEDTHRRCFFHTQLARIPQGPPGQGEDSVCPSRLQKMPQSFIPGNSFLVCFCNFIRTFFFSFSHKASSGRAGKQAMRVTTRLKLRIEKSQKRKDFFFWKESPLPWLAQKLYKMFTVQRYSGEDSGVG